MVEDLAASYIALKLENEILHAQVQRLMEENASLQAQIPEFQKPQASKEDEPSKNPQRLRIPPNPLSPWIPWSFRSLRTSESPRSSQLWGLQQPRSPR